ncbi:MAG: hypothetical protein MPL62_08440 [Alphaproteobacteria bacterium]|nr:hypothetical protein [Alphaproteobacteria bacterium]
MTIDEILSYLASQASHKPLSRYSSVPNGGGVYCFWYGGRCLYAGMSCSAIRGRMSSHINGNGDSELDQYIAAHKSSAKFSYKILPDQGNYICRVEVAAIRRFRPRFNDRIPTC